MNLHQRVKKAKHVKPKTSAHIQSDGGLTISDVNIRSLEGK